MAWRGREEGNMNLQSTYLNRVQTKSCFLYLTIVNFQIRLPLACTHWVIAVSFPTCSFSNFSLLVGISFSISLPDGERRVSSFQAAECGSRERRASVLVAVTLY